MSPRYLAPFVSMVLLTSVAATSADAQRAEPRNSPAYTAGYERGTRAGADDGRRNQDFGYRDKSDYRNADNGYRREYGDRDRYRVEFRIGFEYGYREGYDRYRRDAGWRPGAGGPPPWANGRGRGPGWVGREAAYNSGWNDGYEAGLKDARNRRRFDPTSEGRYRSADRGYKSSYGSRDAYKFAYREAFRDGYERGYQEARRYDGRYTGKPWWWPF